MCVCVCVCVYCVCVCVCFFLFLPFGLYVCSVHTVRVGHTSESSIIQIKSVDDSCQHMKGRGKIKIDLPGVERIL